MIEIHIEHVFVYTGTEDKESLVCRLFFDTPLGRCMQNVSLVGRYLHDFVRMVYKAQSEDKEAEYQVY